MASGQEGQCEIPAHTQMPSGPGRAALASALLGLHSCIQWRDLQVLGRFPGQPPKVALVLGELVGSQEKEVP